MVDRDGRFSCYVVPPVASLLLLAAALMTGVRDAHPLPRGDVAIDAATAQSLVQGDGFLTPWARGSRFRSPLQEDTGSREHAFGHRADQHGPLWPLAGAGLLLGTDLTPGEALAWASYLGHLATLLLVTAAGRRLGLGRLAVIPPLLYAVCAVGSAFSFNGSLYSWQAALYLVAILLAGSPTLSLGRAGLLGAVTGAAYLLNYQSLVLVPAILGARWILAGRFLPGREGLNRLLIGAILFGLILTPWLLRNALVFGNPFYSVNGNYFLARSGIPFHHHLVDGVLLVSPDPHGPVAILRGLATAALLNTPYGLLLLVGLFPGCLVVLAAAVPEWTRCVLGRKKNPYVTSLTLVLVFHLTATWFWPALKTRYLVPAAPLILLLAVFFAGRIVSAGRASLLVIGMALAFATGLLLIRGNLHGTAFLLAFLVAFIPMAGLILITQRGTEPALRGPLVLTGLVVLTLGGAILSRTLPGSAYFNIPPFSDFFGRDKNIEEQVKTESILEAAECLEDLGIEGVVGDLALWHANSALRVITPPPDVAGEDPVTLIRRAAAPYNVGHALWLKNDENVTFTDILQVKGTPFTVTAEGNGWILVAF